MRPRTFFSRRGKRALRRRAQVLFSATSDPISHKHCHCGQCDRHTHTHAHTHLTRALIICRSNSAPTRTHVFVGTRLATAMHTVKLQRRLCIILMRFVTSLGPPSLEGWHVRLISKPIAHVLAVLAVQSNASRAGCACCTSHVSYVMICYAMLRCAVLCCAVLC
jgi:hypothetical protein